MPYTPDESIRLSLGEEKLVRGYPVRRMPLGAFLRASQALAAFPDQTLSILYPDLTPDEALSALRTLTPATAVPVLARALAALPEPVLRLVSTLADIPYATLTDDPALGLDGLVELISAILEVNRIGNFTRAARRLAARLHSLIGSNA